MSLYRMIASLLLVLTFSSSQGTAAAAKKIHTKKKAASRGPDRSLKLVNESGKAVEIFWVHPDTGDTTLMSDQAVMSGAFFPMNSFVGHEFQVREAPGKNGLCENSNDQEVDVDTYECRQVYLKVSENDNQVARITKEFEISFVDNKIEAHQQADSLVSDCQAASKKRLLQQGDSAVAAIEDLVKCVQGGVASALERVNEEIAFQAAVRMDIAGLLENYTCADDTLESTKDIDTQDWYDKLGGETLTVHLKHERRASRIHVIEHFIRPDECQAMEDSAVADLHHATVANGQGGSKRSESRKAMQAGIKVPWDEEKDANPIARLSRRVYDYTNHVLDLGIEEHGQEDLMSIQYFGRGKNDTSPDRYMPHCDGDCTGMKFKDGNRMATMVMYCTVPEEGGHTNFRNSGVHVKPEAGTALFFSYIDPETFTMDAGFTEHSGCPVHSGEKKIVTQWIRLGVDEENPWDSFNTLGIKLTDVEMMGGE